MSHHRDGGDGKQIIGQFSGEILVTARQIQAENHKSCVSLSKEPFHQLDGEPAQSVTVEHHNLADSAAVDSFQKG